MKLNYTTLVIAAVALIVFEARFCVPPWTPLRVAALAVAVTAFFLLALARIQLGRAFSIQARADVLVTTGLYARIRNPIYLFGSLMTAALAVFDGAPLLLLAFLVLIPVQALRARNEAKVLEAKFGPAYAAYRRNTWF